MPGLGGPAAGSLDVRAAQGLLAPRYRTRRRADIRALGEQRPGQAPLTRAFRRLNQGQIDDVALGVASADPNRLVTHWQDRLDRPGGVAAREGERAVDEPPADLDRHLPIVARAQT